MSSTPNMPPIVEPPRGFGRADGRGPGSHQTRSPKTLGRGLTLGLLFGVLAVFGLPLLWMSPAFTRSEKWFWTLAVCLYTLILVSVCILAIMFAYNALVQL